MDAKTPTARDTLLPLLPAGTTVYAVCRRREASRRMPTRRKIAVAELLVVENGRLVRVGLSIALLLQRQFLHFYHGVALSGDDDVPSLVREVSLALHGRPDALTCQIL